MQWLILKLSALETQTVDYALLSKQQQRDTFSASGWQQVKELSQGKRILLLIPSEEVVLSEVDIPATNPKLLARAVPYALEENLAEAVESLHFVYHRKAGDKLLNVAAMNAVRLQQWLDVLEQYGLVPHVILPDVFALPVQPGTAALVIDERQRALFRSDTFSGYCLDFTLLSMLLPKVLEDDAIEKVVLGGPVSMERDLSLGDVFPEGIQLQPEKNLYRQCDASLLQALPLNLLNRFQRKGQQGWTKHLSRWKSVVLLAVLLSVLWTLVMGVKNYQLNNQLKQLDSAIARVYAETFPNRRVDSDYRILHAGMAEQLKILDPGSVVTQVSPLELLAIITPAIKQFDDVTLSTLRFDTTGLNLAVTAASLSRLEQFRAAIDTQGIDAEVVSSTTSANKVESTLRIKKETP